MKSVFVEAATISKAIQKGWEKAGKPKKFSVAILEEAEKNFLGMVKKSAKIGIFFEIKEKPQQQIKERRPLAKRRVIPSKQQQQQPRRRNKNTPKPQLQQRDPKN